MVALPDSDIQSHIERLRRDKTVALDSVKQAHAWRKRNARQCGRMTGDSRTGKTKTCESFLKRYGEPDLSNRVPIIPVAHIHPKQECTSRELFREILEQYGDDLPKGTVGDARSRTLKVLRECKTEMLMIDEADRLKPKTFADVRDIFDKLEISVILIGTKQRLDPAVKKDEQVFNRFRSCYRMGTIPNNQLKTIVGLWERDIIKLPVASNLASEAMLKVLRRATGAARRGYYIGLIDGVQLMVMPPIPRWVFPVDPYPGESLSHFLGRFCRANHATLNQLGEKTGLGAVLGRWEKFRFMPPPTNLQLAALADLVRLDVDQVKLMLPQETIQNRVIRLCSACYAEEPCHRTEWQYKFANKCDRHNLVLLLECRSCKAKLPLPSKWNGTCKRCLTSFEGMELLSR